MVLTQICEAFGANRYPFPEEPQRQRQMNAEVTARLRELHTTVEAGMRLNMSLTLIGSETFHLTQVQVLVTICEGAGGEGGVVCAISGKGGVETSTSSSVGIVLTSGIGLNLKPQTHQGLATVTHVLQRPGSSSGRQATDSAPLLCAGSFPLLPTFQTQFLRAQAIGSARTRCRWWQPTWRGGRCR